MKTRTAMRSAAFAAAGLTIVVLACSNHRNRVDAGPPPDADGRIRDHATAMMDEGRHTFRYDTFGSERFFGGQLGLHRAIAGAAFGGVGAGLPPSAALELGLKVDSDALPPATANALRNNQVNLSDPGVTLSLLAANAVVGLTGLFDDVGTLQSVGIQCALCHSTVDDSLMPGIGRRLDGWANRDLDVGRIVALAPALEPIATVLNVDVPTVRTVLQSWGPGKYDALLLADGRAFRPDNQTAATLIPPAFGLAGVNLHTSTGWGSVTYWNAYVGNLQMHGEGTFFDPRLNDPVKYPIAAATQSYDVRNPIDRTTKKLPALHFYQLAIPAPAPPPGSFDPAAADRGKLVFEGPAGCARCHVPPLFTEPGWNMHTGAEIGIDEFQASRSPDGRYRTAPLRGLHSHQRGGFYHDGRFATLDAVVQHYDTHFTLGLTAPQKTDLVAYLKSL